MTADLEAPILVSGVSGNVGREVVRALRERRAPVRAGVRRPAPERADEVELDFLRPETFGPAVAGARGLFLLRPPAIAKVGPTLNRLVDVAREAGVGHVVFLSVAGAERNPLVPHYRVERRLGSGANVGHTILRPGFFAQNLGDVYRQDIAEENRLYVPAGGGRVAWVDAQDLGDLAAEILTRPAPHAGRGYTLTGGEAITYADAVALLSDALGRPIAYEPATVRGYVAHLRRRQLPAAQIAVQTILHLGLRAGQAARVDPTLGSLLGRPPRTLADYVRDHAGLWQPATTPAG